MVEKKSNETHFEFSFTAELFPTNLRSSALGSCSAAGRLGGMLAPLILYLSVVNEILPAIIISFTCFVATFVALKLPETNKRLGFDESIPDLLIYAVKSFLKSAKLKLIET